MKKDNFIKEDIRNGLVYLQCGIMNAINKLISGEENEVILGEDIPFSLVRKCFEQLKFQVSRNYDLNGWEPDCWIYFQKDDKEIAVQGNLYYGDLKMWVVDETD